MSSSSSQVNPSPILIAILIPVALIILFISVFIYKSDTPEDRYLMAVDQVAQELETTNMMDGNLIKSTYFLYKDKKTEDIEEIKQYIKDHFINVFYVPFVNENGVKGLMPIYSFKSYLEIQAMLILPPFSFNAAEMILVNLYLLTPPKGDFDNDLDFGTAGGESGGGSDDGGSIGGGDLGNVDTGGATKPDYLPFKIQSPCGGNITSYFGMRVHPVTGEKDSFHTGIDIRGSHHQPIMSVANGVVVSASTSKNGYGNYVKIKHTVEGITFYSFYAHLSQLNVHVGQEVCTGTTIGLEGGEPGVDKNPGTSTGHHLHFELRLNSNRSSCIDPAPYLQ